MMHKHFRPVAGQLHDHDQNKKNLNQMHVKSSEATWNDNIVVVHHVAQYRLGTCNKELSLKEMVVLCDPYGGPYSQMVPTKFDMANPMRKQKKRIDLLLPRMHKRNQKR